MVKSRKFNLFNYGLNEAQEKRAAILHNESIIINMLSLGLVGPRAFTKNLTEQIKYEYKRHHDFKSLQALATSLVIHEAARGEFSALQKWWATSGLTACNVGLTLDTPQSMINSLSVVIYLFDQFDWLVKARKAEDIRKAKSSGKHAGFINAQNIDALGQDVNNLNILHDFGLRALHLTSNTGNYVGAGCLEKTNAGVSNFGVKLIERMNELGIIVDTGHSNRQTTVDACAISKQPVIASNTAAKGIHKHDRAKTDEEFVAIARTGGAIGIFMLPFFLSADKEVTIEHFLNHIDYVVKLVGYEHVGIGTHWPFSLPQWGVNVMCREMAPRIGFRPEHGIGPGTTRGYSDHRELINITRGLVSRGYSDEQVKAILGGNWLRIMDLVWK